MLFRSGLPCKVDEDILEVCLLDVLFFLEAPRQQLLDEVVGAVDGDDLPAVHDRQAIAQQLGLVHVMGRQHDRDAVVPDLLDELPHGSGRGRTSRSRPGTPP